MFNTDTLQQLSQLKADIRSQRELVQGLVRSTPKRFGFVRLEDGRDAFLDPDQMQRVLPGDCVEIELLTNAKGQLEARLEKLISSELDTFAGVYRCKGQTHFVEPDVHQFNRWLFIPPQERGQCKEGDYVFCKILRHPYTNEGKAQVKILERIGAPDEPGIEARYTQVKHQLPREWSEPAQQQATAIQGPTADSALEDLTALPFVTIDAENTRDMDDAVYIEAQADGWVLYTAIADPTRYITTDSPLGEAARARVSTVYLLGHTLTMLPPELSHDTFSLVPDAERPALICRIDIAANGEIGQYRFSEGVIRSQHKLSYQGVADLLAGGDSYSDLPETLHKQLYALHALAQARTQYRQTHALVMEDRADYFHVLNEQKKIERIEKRERNAAHRLVEEAMLITNLCAGNLFAQHPGYGIFSSHIGFRTERLDEVLSLLSEDLPDREPGDFSQLPVFRELLRELRQNPENNPKYAPLLSVLQRMQQAGELSRAAIPHFGLGFEAYAMVTSPIRRFQDFHNHLAIKAILHNESAPVLSDEQLEAMQTRIQQGRFACRQLELWLCCQYLSQHQGSVHWGTITQVNASGIGVRLEESGIEGFVLLKVRDKGKADDPATPKPVFDTRRLSLTYGDKVFRLDERVAVQISQVDVEQRRISLELVDSATAERLSVWQNAEPGS